MSKFYIKNILLGIGIGIVLTTLTGIIYSAGMEPQMSKEEIMAMARQYGMVSSSEMIKEDEQKEPELAGTEEIQAEPTLDPGNAEEMQAEPTKDPANVEEIKAEPTEDPGAIEKMQVKIAVAPGDNPNDIARKLLEKGLIDSPDSFVNEIKAMNLQRSMQVGEYTIEEGTDITTIIRVICKRKIK
ncbi:MltG/YceG/YrrL family protein [Acetivibrio mesophilus]|uniref:Aminodeoxychorismate lyase n=1 Tax=Acetivibrio mesophilus TaxID=2487273 RepID=A0A4Q0I755_9FIRM|nr:aminodeoxychorismate lyase [Acetivibrio mesophilus]ODM25648.1 aminodeoxychorismate lyase [Clostridium sp. Bc-iso-3]RXE60233.1 aminodeoxychorismate lyase [Acetivibrio mesophilus]HHV29898.1 endolytic transglycosylase MltG [Clostridium sp.]